MLARFDFRRASIQMPIAPFPQLDVNLKNTYGVFPWRLLRSYYAERLATIHPVMREGAIMDESTICAPHSDTWLITMLDFLGDEQLVDLALAFGRDTSFERNLDAKERQDAQAIKAELLYRLQNNRRVRITVRS